MCYLSSHHFYPHKFHFSYSLLIPWTPFLFFPQFLCCCGNIPGTALNLYLCKLMLLFFPNFAAFLQKTLYFSQILQTLVYLLPDWLSWISPLAQFSQGLVSYFKENFIKLWKNFPFLLTVVFKHFYSSLSSWLLCPDLLPLNLLFLILFPSYFWNFLLLHSTSNMRPLGEAVISSSTPACSFPLC